MASNEMIVTVVGSGTSQGVPVIACHCRVCRSDNKKDHRLRSSIHIQHNDISIMIDTGPDFRQQMLQNQIEYLDAVLFTHCLLYTSPSPRDLVISRMPSSA